MRLKVLSRKEYAISHGFIFVGLICLSIAAYLAYERPVYNLTIFGLWFLFGGICWIVAYVARKFKK